MPIFLVGLSHRTAPVEIREKLTLVDCSLRMALEDLPLGPATSPFPPVNAQAIPQEIPYVNGASQNGKPLPDGSHAGISVLQEAVIISTCNRLEIYGVSSDSQNAGQKVRRFLSRFQGIPDEELIPHIYFQTGREVTQHLMRVTAGLDSMILGEPQILGQVSHAYQEALTVGTAGPILSHLFTQAIHAGKRARTETAISRHTTSVSHAAVLLAKDRVPDLATARVLLVGAGEMADLAADALVQQGAGHFRCINRTHSRAIELAERVGGEALSWYHLPEALTWADVVFTATGAPHTVIHRSDVAPILALRPERPLTFIDMAVPRDVETAIDSLDGVTCYDIDHLQATLDSNLAQRQAAIPDVESILAQECEQFMEWLNGRRVVDTIVDLRRKATEVARTEVDEALSRLRDLDEREQEVINRMAHRLVNKLLHQPTVRLKSHAATGNGHTYAHMLRDLFGLEHRPDANLTQTNGIQAGGGQANGVKTNGIMSAATIGRGLGDD